MGIRLEARTRDSQPLRFLTSSAFGPHGGQNLSYKRHVKGESVDCDAFLEEMVVAVSAVVNAVLTEGEAVAARGGPELHVVLAFP